MTSKGIKIDGKYDVYSPYRSKCATCKHFDLFEFSCKAFPNEIPDNLLNGSLVHDKVFAGQVGDTIFTPVS